MADRTVTYRFRGEFGNLAAGLTAMGRGVADLGVKMTALDKNGAKMRSGLSTIGSAAGKMGLVAAAGLGVMIVSAARFDQAMSNVQAATHETAGNMELLRKAAIKAGADTKYSATEAAGAIEDLAKAGVSTKDILGGGLSGSLNLAAAGSIDVADAASIAATAMTQFRLSGDQVPHIADLLAAAAGKAQGDVSDMSMALKQSGLVASQMGLSIEDTTGTLAAFASAGLLGSDAGTSFRTMLLRLANPTTQSAELMAQLGIQAYNAQGQFVGIQSISGQLAAAFKNQSQAQRDAALATIFGSDAIRAANVLYNQGAEGIQSWINKTNDQGYAAETAATKMDNLAGDLEQLRGSLETAFIGAGEGSQGPLRKLVRGTTEVVNALNAVPTPAKNAATALLGITAAVGGATWFGSEVINGISDARDALKALGIEAVTTREKLALVGTGGAAAALGVGTLIDTLSQMDSLSRSNAAADATVKSYQDLSDALSSSNVGKYASDLGINLDRLSQDLIENGKQGEYASQVIDQLAESSHGFGALMKSEAGHILPFYTDSASKAADANKDLTAIIEKNGSVLGLHKAHVESAAGATNDFGVAQRQAAQQTAAMRNALADEREAAKKTADSFVGLGDKLNDPKVSLSGWLADLRKQANALRDFRVNAETAARRGLDQGLIKSLQEAGPEGAMRMKQLADATKSQIAQANGAWQAGQRQVKMYTNAIGGVPRDVSTQVHVDNSQAFNAINAVKYALAQMHDKTVTLNTIHIESFITKRGGQPGLGSTSADGGTVPKTGLPYADRHPYLLADGEEVISNRFGQADRHRSLLKAINAGRLADGGTAGGDRGGSGGDSSKQNKQRQAIIKQLEGIIAKREKQLDREDKRLDDLKQRDREIKSGVTAGLRSDIFAAPDGNPWSMAQAVANPNAALQSDIQKGRRFIALVRQLKARGVSGAALAEIVQTGDIARAELMASMSNADLATYQRLYTTRQRVDAAAGQSVSTALGVTRAITRQAADVAAMREDIHGLRADLKQLEKRADKSRHKAAEHGAKQTGDKVNGAATKGHRRGGKR